MNIAAYFNTTKESEPLYHAIQSLNAGLEEGELNDASIFYDDCGPNSIPANFGFFDAIELWHYTGNLIATSVSTISKVTGVVNNFNKIYYHGWSADSNALSLIGISSDDSITVICNSKNSKDEYTRLTGKEPQGVVENFNLQGIKKVIK
jgi:hypothetical protein|tara:strand:+ start:30409 stop:30855 length:447 start_codon:yes stop_codon:yes gene_type:complete